MEFPRTGISMIFPQNCNITYRGCAYEVCYNTQLEALEKIKENPNITSMNEMALRSVLIEIR